MRKAISLLFALVFTLLSSSHVYALVSRMPIDPLISPNPTPLKNFGDDQNYSVIFRGNGQAIVAFKSVLTNSTQQIISEIHIHFSPATHLNNITIYQVLPETPCLKYNNPTLPLPSQPQSLNQSSATSNTQLNKIDSIPGSQPNSTCEEYSPPDFQNITGNIHYQKSLFEYSADTVTIKLPQPILPNTSGSYFIYFRTNAYAQKNIFGAYAFSFKTPTFDNSINTLQVGITADSDLILQGKNDGIEYNGGQNSIVIPYLLNDSTSPIINAKFDDFYNQIGQGDLVKNVTILDPLESYTVQGFFADNQIKLHGNVIVISIIIFLIIAGIVFIVGKYLFSRIHLPLTETATQKDIPTKNLFDVWNKSSSILLFLLAGFIGFSAVFVIAVYAICSFFFFQLIGNTPYTFPLFLFVFLISITIYGFLICIPSVIYGYKKGWIWGLITFSITIFWLFFFFTIAIIILFFYYPTVPILSNFRSAIGM